MDPFPRSERYRLQRRSKHSRRRGQRRITTGQTKLPGYGHSSPVLWGDKIFLTSAIEDGRQRIVLCINAISGKILWERRYNSTPHKKHLKNSYASSTPAVDEKHVYVCWSAPKEFT